MAMSRTAGTKRPARIHEPHLNLIGELATALELCLACDGRLTWSAEQDARLLLERARKIAGGSIHENNPRQEKRNA